MELFVNYVGFSPAPIDATGWDDTWDSGLRQNLQALKDRFWSTLFTLNPCSYFAEGDLLTFVTKSERDRDLGS